MALAGHGLAFLPHSAVVKELREHLLVRATSHLWRHPDQTMLLRAYRVKPARANAANPKPQPTRCGRFCSARPSWPRKPPRKIEGAGQAGPAQRTMPA
jgi:hypothetical protein